LREGPGRVLRERRDLARLRARRRTRLGAGERRARLLGHVVRVDGEILELHLLQARQRFLCLGGIERLARRRIVEELERRQLARLRGIEQRHLALALDARALLEHRERRVDARRRAQRRSLVLRLERLLPRLAPRAPFRRVAPGGPARARPADAPPGERAQAGAW